MDTATETLQIIIVEVASPKALHGFNHYHHWGDEDHEFCFRTFSPIKLEQYPGSYFLYAVYSQQELDELYSKVDMTHRIEPVDNLMWSTFGAPYREFLNTNLGMLEKLGKFKLIPIKDFSREDETISLGYPYVLDELFGQEVLEVIRENYVVLFPDKDSMLQAFDYLISDVKIPRESLVSGTRDGRFALSVALTKEEIACLKEIFDRFDLVMLHHSEKIPVSNLGFMEDRTLCSTIT
jgi:hypothetical protein